MLAYAAAERWIVLSHDVNTMSAAAYSRIAAGQPMAGLLLVRQQSRLVPTLTDLCMIWSASEAEVWADRVEFLLLCVESVTQRIQHELRPRLELVALRRSSASGANPDFVSACSRRRAFGSRQVEDVNDPQMDLSHGVAVVVDEADAALVYSLSR